MNIHHVIISRAGTYVLALFFISIRYTIKLIEKIIYRLLLLHAIINKQSSKVNYSLFTPKYSYNIIKLFKASHIDISI